jgi:hypothetical protein
VPDLEVTTKPPLQQSAKPAKKTTTLVTGLVLQPWDLCYEGGQANLPKEAPKAKTQHHARSTKINPLRQTQCRMRLEDNHTPFQTKENVILDHKVNQSRTKATKTATPNPQPPQRKPTGKRS